ncbi:MAG: S41 family peptidase [Clostridiales bacterium]|jgi:uncharacterized membrane protein YbaN (DUF454 family)|nr:S41 family peptidase [Clostridiales bacterium]
MISIRKYRFFQCGFIVLLLAVIGLVYANFDYLAFKLLIAGNYIFTDTLDEWYAQSLGAENVQGYYRSFDDAVIAAVTEKIRSVGSEYGSDRYTFLYTPQKYKLSKDVEKADAAAARLEALSPRTVYMSLPNISHETKNFMLENKQTLVQYQNLILDLRDDYGGLLADFYKMAELFTPKGAVLGYEKTRLPFLSHAVKSSKQPYFHFDQVIILQNGETASSAEGLILALKGNLDQVTLIGAKTFGKGIGQVTTPLKGGFAVKATVLLVSGPGDQSIHKIGIKPDISYEASDIIEFARQYAENE